MRVIFMGTPDFSVGTLEALKEAGHDVCLAVTQPDRPKGRGKALQPTPVKEAALRLNIPVYQPQRIRDAACTEELEKYQADIMVVIAFGQILPKALLEMTPYGCINVHASLLPKYRGAAPVQWAILQGETVTGVTTMQMDEGLDTGDMLLKEEITIAPDETGGSLHDKLSVIGARLCVETLRALEDGGIPAKKQPKDSPTVYAKMLDKKMGNIDWAAPACEIERRIRALSPWPGGYTYLGGKMLKIWKAECADADLASFGDNADADLASSGDNADAKLAPSGDNAGEEPVPSGDAAGAVCGEISSVEKDAFCVQTGDGVLRIRELQLQGKKRMDAAAFLRGYTLKPGMRLSREAQ